jgi:E3 SUMO-protein ligase PIAS1
MFNRLKDSIENPYTQQNTSQYSSLGNSMSPSASSTPSSFLGVASSAGYNMAGMNNYRIGGISGYRSKLDVERVAFKIAEHPLDLEFKPSPFYTIQQQLGETEECQGMNLSCDDRARLMLYRSDDSTSTNSPHKTESHRPSHIVQSYA